MEAVSPSLVIALAAAQVVLAESTAERERNPERAEKMAKVAAVLRSDFIAASGDPETDPRVALESLGHELDEETRLAFLVEVYFLDAFSPYTLRYLSAQRRRGLRDVSDAMGEQSRAVRRIVAAANSAKASHRKRSWGRAGLIGVAAAVALGVGGLVAAPMLGGAIGAGAGLSGAAATGHGLALLGGGALAAGGAGVAGGMWVVAGAGAALGAAAGTGGSALYELGAAQARGELLKLQVSFKVAVLGTQADVARAQSIIGGLTDQATDLRARLDRERALNERTARRVKDLQETIEAIEEAVLWMETEQEQVA